MFVPILLATVCLASSTVLATIDKPFYDLQDAENLFKEFVQEHKKVYNRKEYYERLEIFKENLIDINERNAMFPETVFAVNHFSDLKPKELDIYFGSMPTNETTHKIEVPSELDPMPYNFDWRTKHAVSHVKDQGKCGSAYIFSAIGAIEGRYAVKHKQCFALSEGQVLDCLNSTSCSEGSPSTVLVELYKKKFRIEKEEDYPYVPQKQACKKHNGKGKVQVTDGVLQVITNADIGLMTGLLYMGPLSVGIHPSDFISYKGGIITPNKCKGEDKYISLLLVGYGVEKGKQYWILKHSWGEQYGEKGYSRMYQEDNACGIFDHVYTVASVQ
ncbi:procathepsin L-like [Leguminivora glycinivorella]|uniref:procathepsin L-like n=1 Tax=Leguminivora glycinivorella TaxID=1035111 RepID=UPI0020109A49|nr:procathepsin L-like [Leguminivora glycinivorella]